MSLSRIGISMKTLILAILLLISLAANSSFAQSFSSNSIASPTCRSGNCQNYRPTPVNRSTYSPIVTSSSVRRAYSHAVAPRTPIYYTSPPIAHISPVTHASQVRSSIPLTQSHGYNVNYPNNHSYIPGNSFPRCH